MHVENLTPKTRQRYLDFLQLREEGKEKVLGLISITPPQ